MSVRNMMINRLIGGHCSSSRKHVVLCGNAGRSLMTARKRDQAIYPMRTSNTALLVCDMQEVFRSRIYGMDSVILNKCGECVGSKDDRHGAVSRETQAHNS